MPRKRNKNGVYLTEVEQIPRKSRFITVSRWWLKVKPLAGAVHFPNNPEIYDLAEAQQLTAEEQVEKWVDGKKKSSGTAKSDEMRRLTALSMHWQLCG
jgi:phage terminase large subunit GpA-like protein